MSINEHILAGPTWILFWVIWMGLINMSAVLFARNAEARWVILALLGAAFLTDFRFQTYGYAQILSWSHLVILTPLVFYLWGAREGFDKTRIYGKWLWVMLFTNIISLILTTGYLMLGAMPA